MNPTASTITELAAALRDGSTTPRALLDAALAHVDRTEKDLNAYLSVTRDLAKQQADAAAKMLESIPDTASPLCGIPMALKDVLCVDGIETTAGVEDPAGLQAAVHRHRRAATLRCRRGVCRQDQLRRVRDGVVDRELRVWAGRQSLGRRARAGRQQRRQRGDRRRRNACRTRSARDTGGSIRQPAALTRRRRFQADLRTRFAVRAHRVRLVARPDRAVHANRRGLRARVLGDRRPRSARQHLRSARG